MCQWPYYNDYDISSEIMSHKIAQEQTQFSGI